MGYLAGIDLGTTSTKVLIMDAAGSVLGKGSAAYDLLIPQMAYAEQDPAQWWEAVKAALQGAAAAAGINPGEIEGISFSGQMHGLVALGADKNLSATPSSIWINDLPPCWRSSARRPER